MTGRSRTWRYYSTARQEVGPLGAIRKTLTACRVQRANRRWRARSSSSASPCLVTGAGHLTDCACRPPVDATGATS